MGATDLRAIEQVRVHVGHRLTAYVTGVTHRYPREYRISMATAAKLARAGVPVRIEDDRRTNVEGA